MTKRLPPDKIKGKFGEGGWRMGAGRKKGVPNKLTMSLKEATLLAAERAGGKEGLVGYLLRQANKRNPAPFMALLTKILPMQVTGKDGGPIQTVDISKLSSEQLAALEPVIAALAAAESVLGEDQAGAD